VFPHGVHAFENTCDESCPRSGLAWFKIGIWKLRGMRKGFDKGRCPLCSEEEDPKHILLKCSETRKWREQFLSRK
jgi:hypothetical protein